MRALLIEDDRQSMFVAKSYAGPYPNSLEWGLKMTVENFFGSPFLDLVILRSTCPGDRGA